MLLLPPFSFRNAHSPPAVSKRQEEVGKGAFQECDQLAAVAGHVKWAGQAAAHADIPRVVAEAFQVGKGDLTEERMRGFGEQIFAAWEGWAVCACARVRIGAG